MDLNEKWLSYSLNHNSNTSDIPIILIERGPKNITEVKKVMKNFNNCVILFLERNTLFLKIPGASITIVLDSSSEYERTASILQSCNLDNAKSDLQLQLGIKKAIEVSILLFEVYFCLFVHSYNYQHDIYKNKRRFASTIQLKRTRKNIF